LDTRWSGLGPNGLTRKFRTYDDRAEFDVIVIYTFVAGCNIGLSKSKFPIYVHKFQWRWRGAACARGGGFGEERVRTSDDGVGTTHAYTVDQRTGSAGYIIRVVHCGGRRNTILLLRGGTCGRRGGRLRRGFHEWMENRQSSGSGQLLKQTFPFKSYEYSISRIGLLAVIAVDVPDENTVPDVD